MNQIIPLVAGVFCCSLLAQAEEALWSGNKLTAAQPFPGKISAVHCGWPGYYLLIEEIGGSREIIARVWVGFPVAYHALDRDKGKSKDGGEATALNFWTRLSPAIDIDQFSWSIGPWRIGRTFGKEDILRKVIFANKPQSK